MTTVTPGERGKTKIPSRIKGLKLAALEERRVVSSREVPEHMCS